LILQAWTLEEKNDEKLKFMRALSIINHFYEEKEKEKRRDRRAFVLMQLDGIVLAGPRDWHD